MLFLNFRILMDELTEYVPFTDQSFADQPYYEHRCPPDLFIAINHGRAHSLGKLCGTGNLRCPCCMEQVEKKNYEIRESPDKLHCHGIGLPLFFNSLKFSIILLVSILSISSVCYMIRNGYGSDCTTEDKALDHDFDYDKADHKVIRNYMTLFCHY